MQRGERVAILVGDAPPPASIRVLCCGSSLGRSRTVRRTSPAIDPSRQIIRNAYESRARCRIYRNGTANLLRYTQREPESVAYSATKPEKCRLYRFISIAYGAYSAKNPRNEPGKAEIDDERTRACNERTRESRRTNLRSGSPTQGTTCRTRKAKRGTIQSITDRSSENQFASATTTLGAAIRKCRANPSPA